jgi:hypothetical protein
MDFFPFENPLGLVWPFNCIGRGVTTPPDILEVSQLKGGGSFVSNSHPVKDEI